MKETRIHWTIESKRFNGHHRNKWREHYITRESERAVFQPERQYSKGKQNWNVLDLLLRGGSFDGKRYYLHKLKISNSFLDQK